MSDMAFLLALAAGLLIWSAATLLLVRAYVSHRLDTEVPGLVMRALWRIALRRGGKKRD